MGLMYIGSMLKKVGHETRIHDCAVDHNNFHSLKRLLKDWQPDFIGISIIATEIECTKKIMSVIRDIVPNVPVTFGGPWPSVSPEKAINEVGADFVVIGEGELVFPKLVDAINKGFPVGFMPGLAFAIDGQIKINPGSFLTEEGLNALPFPAWELLDHKLYAKHPSFATIGIRPYMTLITSRGCPFKCIYCHRTMGKIYRKRSAQSVLAEIETLYSNHGFKEFEIADDCFNLDRIRMYEILTGIRDRFKDVKLHFPNALKADIMEPEDMTLLKQAGTVTTVFAIETATPRLQKMIRKNLNIEKASKAINASVTAGIFSSGFFMIGFPSETYKEASATVEFALGSTLHRAFFMVPMPFPGTELAEMVSKGKKAICRHGAMHSMNYFNSTLNISSMSDHDMQKIFRSAYRRFYINPRRMFRMVVHFPGVLSLFRYAILFIMKFIPKKSSYKESKYFNFCFHKRD